MKKQVKLNPEVVAHLNDAVSADNTRFAATRRAAIAAYVEVPALYPKENATNAQVGQAIDAVVERYRPEFKGNNNIRQDFKNVLTVMHYAQQPITVFGKKGKEDVHTSGNEVLGLADNKPASHDLTTAAATEVRAKMGIGRNRSPQTPTKKPAAQEQAEGISFLSMLDSMLATPANVQSFKKALNERGYNLTKLRKK